MPEVDMERVPENGSDCDTNTQSSLDNNSDSGKVIKKTRKRGIIFLSTIPPYMNVAKIREIFSEFGDVGRIYLQPSTSECFEVMFLIDIAFSKTVIKISMKLTLRGQKLVLDRKIFICEFHT